MSRLFAWGSLLTVALVLAGCSEPPPESEGRPAPETPPAETPAAETPAAGTPTAEMPATEAPAATDPAPEESSAEPSGGSSAEEAGAGEPVTEAVTVERPADDSPDEPAEAASGPKAPEIQAAYWLNTEPLTLADLRGKIVVLEFWATWCPPCRTTIPHLSKLYKTYKGRGVVFISLTDEPQETVEPFVRKMNMPYPIGGGSPTGRAYGVRGIPHAFIIDPSGRVVAHGHPMGGLEEAIERQLKATPPE